MKSHRAILAVVIAVLFVAGLAAPFGRWPWSLVPVDFRLPLLGFITNLVLVAVTWIYVFITREQLRELQIARHSKAILQVRVPDICNQDVKYGKGNHRYREGPPIYIDVWNVSTPTIMVLAVTLKVKGLPENEGLQPQSLVESGKVASINVAYQLLALLSAEYGDQKEELIGFPTETTAVADFTVDYFSVDGKQRATISSSFKFFVTDNYINTKIVPMP